MTRHRAIDAFYVILGYAVLVFTDRHAAGIVFGIHMLLAGIVRLGSDEPDDDELDME